MEIENQNGGEGQNTDQGISSEGMAAIEAKFASVYEGADSAELTAADAPVDGARQPGEGKSPARQRIEKQSKQEAADELIEGGQVKEGVPEGVDAPENQNTEGQPEAEGTQDAEQQSAPEIPLDPLSKHIANANGYSDERIARLFKADPELAAEHFGRLTSDYTNLSRQYATQSASPVAPGTQPAPQQPAQTSAVSALNQLFTPENLSAFAEANGEEMVEKFMKPLYQAVVGPVLQMQAKFEAQERQLVAREATQTFDTLSKQYAGLYGQGAEISDQQRGARQQVASLADAIRAGAMAQGVEMSVSDALNRAHLVVSAPRVKETARREVIQQVQKRESKITAKPTQRRAPAAGGSRSEAAAAEAYARKAIELGIEV